MSVWLPTGYGKSLCYQALPFVFEHKMGLADSRRSSAVLVLIPVVTLMLDQVMPSIELMKQSCQIQYNYVNHF